MELKETLLENEELKEQNARLERKVEWQRRFINGLKLSNSKLTLERNSYVEENCQLKNELAKIKAMGMYEFAKVYCSDEQMEADAKAFARSLGVGE